MNTSAAGATSRLEGLVGAPNFTNDPAALAAYAVGPLAPVAAVRASSGEEVAEIVRFAASENLAVIASGARTKVAMGALPHRYDLALDLSALDKIAAYDPGDLTLAVEPGVSLAAIGQTLAQHGQFLPLGAPFANRSTIGGTIVSGVDGPMRQFYGTSRDFVLGMEFVTGEGVVAKSGGRVVKNVSGYDLHKPLIGSLGTLAVATRINLRTFPAPQSMRGFLVQFPSADSAVAMRHAIAKSPLRPLTLEILSTGAAELFTGNGASAIETNPLPGPFLAHRTPHGHGAMWTLATSFAGNDPVLARCEHELRTLAERAGSLDFHLLADRSALAAVFGRIREFMPIALASSPAATVLKLAVPPVHLAHALCAAKHTADEHSLPFAAMARGVGVTYVALLPVEHGEHALQRVVSAANRLIEDTSRIEGTVTIPWAPAGWKAKLNIWGCGRTENSDLPLMRKLKSVFDPHSILAPGRFVGGI